MQFIAECGIEYGLQFVTQFFLNPPNGLYIKKDCDFFQSYEKTSEMQKENWFFFSNSQIVLCSLYRGNWWLPRRKLLVYGRETGSFPGGIEN